MDPWLTPRARDNWVRVHAEAERLRLRLGPEHAVVGQYERLIEDLGSAGDQEFDSRKFRHVGWVNMKREKLDEAASEFVKLCIPHVGVKDDPAWRSLAR